MYVGTKGQIEKSELPYYYMDRDFDEPMRIGKKMSQERRIVCEKECLEKPVLW